MARGWIGPHTAQMKNERNKALIRDFENGMPGKQLMAKYGLTRQTVYQITRGHKRRKKPQPTEKEGAV
jgi:Mor family transcriptional regulator